MSATLQGGQVQRYSLRLQAGDFAAVRIPQLQGNLAAVVFDPEGAVVGIFDQNGEGQAEVVTIDAARAGEYAIQIAMFEWDASDVSYTIELTRHERTQYRPADRAAQLFESWYEPGGPGAVLVVMQDGEISYQGAIGVENSDGHRPLSLQSPIDLASVSKQFTAYGVALLVERGQLRLDDDVRRYLPELPDYGTPITVQHLLEHTSGLRDWDGLFALTGRNIEDGISIDDVVAMAARQQSLNFTPGAEQRYSNTGYVLLAKIIERVTGQPYDLWATENIFAPLGMRECSLERDAAIPARVTSFRRQFPEPISTSTERTITLGSSGLACSAHDLQRWIENYRTDPLGGGQVQRLVTQASASPTGTETDYVFGNWHGRRGDHAMVGHQGLAAGFRTSVHDFPDDHVRVIYLANDGNDATYERVRVIENLFLGIAPGPIEAPTDDYVPSTQAVLSNGEIAELVGRYHSDEIEADYEIFQVGQSIVARHRAAGDIRLTRQQADAFSSDKWFVPSLTFVRDAAGRPVGLRIESEDVGSLFFRRVRSGGST
ncbi:beta-lactamase family protein [Candidatus Viadribacter manganicus]|nr:beta-lactamase family protein [Candidatus Viadribacter manganicus]